MLRNAFEMHRDSEKHRSAGWVYVNPLFLQSRLPLVCAVFRSLVFGCCTPSPPGLHGPRGWGWSRGLPLVTPAGETTGLLTRDVSNLGCCPGLMEQTGSSEQEVAWACRGEAPKITRGPTGLLLTRGQGFSILAAVRGWQSSRCVPVLQAGAHFESVLPFHQKSVSPSVCCPSNTFAALGEPLA